VAGRLAVLNKGPLFRVVESIKSLQKFFITKVFKYGGDDSGDRGEYRGNLHISPQVYLVK